VVTVDVEGAFLHADMTNEVYVEIGPQLAQLLVAYNPSVYRQFVRDDGKLVVRLLKALYALSQPGYFMRTSRKC
jgi:hypothetical protein